MSSDDSVQSNTRRSFLPRLGGTTWRAIGLSLLALMMLLPVGWVGGIVNERNWSYTKVLNDIARSWGEEQSLYGPVVVVPYTSKTVSTEEVTDKDGTTRTVEKIHRQLRHATFLPDTLDIDVKLAEQFRQRSIYSALVYNADASVKASFGRLDVAALSDHIESIHWNKAWLAIGLSDTRAIESVQTIQFGQQQPDLSPGTRLDWLGRGFHAPLTLSPEETSHALTLQMRVKGSQRFLFAPFGETTTATISSSWPHPSFIGSTLPDSHEIGDDGFKARWEIAHLVRNYPQQWVDHWNPEEIRYFLAGVRMFEPVTLYSNLTRAVKYGILFIGLTFITLFGFEVATRKPIHGIQYGLIGSALCLFYLVVLSLSEHFSFLPAYLAGAGLVVLMISGYTLAVLRDRSKALIIFVLLSGLYAMLYSVLQLEDYALLMGTGLLVVVIGVLMVATRNLHRLATD